MAESGIYYYLDRYRFIILQREKEAHERQL